LEAALTADKLGAGSDADDEKEAYGTIANELLTLSFSTYEEQALKDVRIQRPCVMSMIGTLMACRSLGKNDYEALIMTVSKFAAKMTKQSEQCEMVTRCSHLFYVLENDGTTVVYANPQRSLECLQRSLKLANACTTANVSNLKLFVELFDIYLYFFEKNNPHITGSYITGLAALIKEHSTGIPLQFGGSGMPAAAEAKQQFLQIVRYIKAMKAKPETVEKFRDIDVSSVET
jgi:vacuolar protein sorting-associated protein 35